MFLSALNCPPFYFYFVPNWFDWQPFEKAGRFAYLALSSSKKTFKFIQQKAKTIIILSEVFH